ncbi:MULTISPECIES: hypothetical protein [Vibrio]|uniref:hypothetical protein n=1 Tax=Vibrio TaxID=662 RepID=UPI001CDD87F2|nr:MULTISPECIES: hypothetical protein [Vibrio]MCA2466082.1 hypothetical protein [Vibrio alginolyticus]MDW2194960.1 hypothetical protein [Vibrio sp. 2084]
MAKKAYLLRYQQLKTIEACLNNISEQPVRYNPQVKEDVDSFLKKISPLILNTPITEGQIVGLPEEIFFSINDQLQYLINNQNKISSSLISNLIKISEAWNDADKYENPSDEYSNNKLSGLIKQLSVRQEELNLLSKKVKDDVTEHEKSAVSQLIRQTNKLLNQLESKSEEIQSEITSQIENNASKVRIDFLNEGSKLKRDLLEEVSDFVDSTLDQKQKEVDERTEKRAKSLLEKVDIEVSNLSDKVNEQIEEFCTLNDALRKTLSFTASDALADTSIKQAEQEKETADTLRSWGVLWLVVSIGLFLVTFDYDKLVDGNNVPQYTLILLRSFFLIVGIAPGFYLLRESARHRTDERRYRQKGIQLATIDGYFAEFEDSERNKVKKDLSKHYFHGAEHFVDSSSVDNVQSKYDKIFDKVVSSKQLK